MDRYEETAETWNKVALLYQEKFMHLDLYNKTYDFFCDSVSSSKASILEIGCGPGNITRYILAAHPGFCIYGIDFAPNMIELAKSNNPSASFEVMDARDISALQIKFDGIICGFCLPYLSHTDAEKFLSDIHNLLHNNGILYISFVAGNPEKSNFQAASTGERSYFYYHAIDTILAIFTDKFEVLKTFELEYNRSQTEKEVHTIIVAKKINGWKKTL